MKNKDACDLVFPVGINPTKNTNMTYPTINRNGATAESLYSQYRNARIALMDAIDMMIEATPHGRDYQLNPGAYSQAAYEHRARIESLNRIKDQIEKIEMHCFEAIPNK